MIAVARAKGWAVLDRFVADGYVLDMAGGKVAGTWPRSSTLKKNRFHEKHLATHGALGWHYATGDALLEAFDAYAFVEEKSWIADHRSEEHTSELQSLMRISSAVLCLKKQKTQ